MAAFVALLAPTPALALALYFAAAYLRDPEYAVIPIAYLIMMVSVSQSHHINA